MTEEGWGEDSPARRVVVGDAMAGRPEAVRRPTESE